MIWNQQGKELIGGNMAFAMETPDGKIKILISEFISALAVSNLDLFQADEVSVSIDDPSPFARYLQKVQGGLTQHRSEQSRQQALWTRYGLACRIYALLHILNGHDPLSEDIELVDFKYHCVLKTKEAETVNKSIKNYRDKFEKQIQDGLWHPDDLCKLGIQRNLWDSTGKAATPWLFCNLVLWGHAQDSWTKSMRDSFRSDGLEACDPQTLRELARQHKQSTTQKESMSRTEAARIRSALRHINVEAPGKCWWQH